MPRHQPSDVALTTREGTQYVFRPPNLDSMHNSENVRPISNRDGYAIDVHAVPTREQIDTYRRTHPNMDVDIDDEGLRVFIVVLGLQILALLTKWRTCIQKNIGRASARVRDVSLPSDPAEAQRMRELYDLIRAENVDEVGLFFLTQLFRRHQGTTLTYAQIQKIKCQDQMKTEFKRPNLQLAKIYANMNHPRKVCFHKIHIKKECRSTLTLIMRLHRPAARGIRGGR